ncbi:MAG TPA: hypothetical protein DDW55_02110 [Gammaproteobacteria bacterium]|nr:hypothetical protein [Gammaproteobacteria bacterium]
MHDPKETADRFDGILDSYYKAWFRYHPEAGVEAGHDEYAGCLTPYGDDDAGALAALSRELMFSLEELDAEMLDADRQVDYELAWSSAALEAEELQVADWRYRDPERYLPVNAIYQLLIRPVGNFEEALQSRLEQIPEYLRGARRQLAARADEIPSLWMLSSLQTAREGSRFLRSIPHHPRLQQCERAIPGLEELAARGAKALQNFADCMESDLAPKAQGDFACGERIFSHILNYRHFLDVSADQVHELGRELFEETQSRLREACMVINGNDEVDMLSEKLRSNHPAADKLLSTYRSEMSAARKFLTKHDIVSLPEQEHLSIVETPAFFRHEVPFAAYHEPVPADPEQRAFYYVTSTDDPELLAHHDLASIRQTCVHEAWPGHHLQFVTANLNSTASSLPRLLNPSATLYEGWALYCEQMMLEEGFQAWPEQEFIMLKDRLWRAMRIMIDVELHCRGLDLETAAKRMGEELGMSLEHAMADLTWYTRSPGVPMGYATGWSLINDLRNRVKMEEADAFTLKSFHDRLLSGGSMALPLVIRRTFGDDVWAEVEKSVFRLNESQV